AVSGTSARTAISASCSGRSKGRMVADIVYWLSSGGTRDVPHYKDYAQQIYRQGAAQGGGAAVLRVSTASRWLRKMLPLSSSAKRVFCSASITGPFTSERWKPTPSSRRRWFRSA